MAGRPLRRHTRGPALHDELAASRDRLATGRTQLAQARREREPAKEIRLATRRLVEERLHERATADRPVHAESDRTQQPDDEPFAAAEDFGLAPLHEVDHVLEVSEERIREQADQLDNRACTGRRSTTRACGARADRRG